MTKPITAAAVMKLWEDGEIDLMDPVSRYLPAFTEQKVWQNGVLSDRVGEIELHDLLNMTSGIPYPGDQAAPSFNRLFEEAEASVDSPDAFTTVELEMCIRDRSRTATTSGITVIRSTPTPPRTTTCSRPAAPRCACAAA